jgi:deoxyribodipyrimidine photo-lyase
LALEVVATVGTSIIWFRRDLRLADHPALLAALAHGTTTPLFVLDPLFVKRSGAARFAFLLRNIRALDASMNRAIVVRHGDPLDIVPRFAQEVGADRFCTVWFPARRRSGITFGSHESRTRCCRLAVCR